MHNILTDDIYYGHIKNNVPWGKGIMILKDGYRYDG